jgi:protein TonB
MPASYRSSSYDARPPLRERIAASGLSLGIIAAIILALLWVTTAPLLDMGPDHPLTTFNVGTERAPVVAPPQQKRAQPRAEPKRSPPPPPANRPPPPPVTVPTTPGMIVLSRGDYASSDIGKMKKADEGQGAEVADSGGGKPVYGPSEAPGGRTLHAADWYREPTRAEMITYMPPNLREGWGVIACKTADRYRVEDCRQVGESPGSGIARGMRLASFQFLVRPPMVNGKPQIGAWVRIRFDIVQGITR